MFQKTIISHVIAIIENISFKGGISKKIQFQRIRNCSRCRSIEYETGLAKNAILELFVLLIMEVLKSSVAATIIKYSTKN